MIAVIISVGALALTVASSVVAVWHISSLNQRMRALESERSTIASNLTSIDEKLAAVQKTAPATLAAAVADLGAAVDSLRDTHQRFAGKVWQRLGAESKTNGDGRPPVPLPGQYR